MAKKIKATHRTRRPHQVFFDPACHFLNKKDAPEAGARVNLPVGTHVIPTEAQLSNLPDRFQSLSAPEAPAEAVIEDEDEEEDGEDERSGADIAVDDALSQVNDVWEALTTAQLEDLGDGYEIEEDDVGGTGSNGNVLKADWITAIQGARKGD